VRESLLQLPLPLVNPPSSPRALRETSSITEESFSEALQLPFKFFSLSSFQIRKGNRKIKISRRGGFLVVKLRRQDFFPIETLPVVVPIENVFLLGFPTDLP